jgi:hypothetical protein
MAVIGIKSDIRDFAQRAGLSALLPTYWAKANFRIGSMAHRPGRSSSGLSSAGKLTFKPERRLSNDRKPCMLGVRRLISQVR